MKINWIEAEGFRGFKDPVRFELGEEITEIVGDNGAGKSSVMEIISFGLAGADKYGKERATDRLMNQFCNELRIAIGLEINGQAYEIERQAVKLKNKTESVVLVNRMKSSQDEIDSIIGDRRLFMAVFLPKYFIGLSDSEARTELMALLPLPKQEDVMDLLSEDEPQFVEFLKGVRITDPETYIKKENEFLKENKNELIRLEGKEDEIKSALAVDIPDAITIDTSEIESTREAIKAIEGVMPKLTDYSALQQERQTLLAEYNALQKGLKFEEQIIECDNCGHKINLSAEQEKKNEEITLKMTECMEKGKNIAAKIESIKLGNDTAIAEFEKANAETLHELRSELQRLEANLRTTEQHNIRVEMLRDNYNQAKARQAQVRNEKAIAVEIIEKSEQRIKAAKAFNIKRCEMQMEGISGILNRLSIRLFDIVKSTGEIKPAFKLEYDGKEVRILSTSEEIRCFLEISKLFRKLTKRNYPVFIDCAESITNFEKPESQLIMARVVKGQALTVNKEAAV